MDILLVENRYEDTGELEDLYNSFTDADVDVYEPDDIDFDEMSEAYDVVLSELVLGDGVMGPDVLDRFEADRKALYSFWREEEAKNNTVISRELERYDVYPKPGPRSLNLEEMVEEQV